MIGLEVSSQHPVSTDNLQLPAMQSDGDVAHDLPRLGNPAAIDSQHSPNSGNHHQERIGDPYLANQTPRLTAGPASSVTKLERCVPLSGDDLLPADLRYPSTLRKQLMRLPPENQSKVPVAMRVKIFGLFFDIQGIIVGLKTNLARVEGRNEEIRAQLVEVTLSEKAARWQERAARA